MADCRIAWVALAGLISGCQWVFDARFACEMEGQCPEGQRCVERRCVRKEDNPVPSLSSIAPKSASVGATGVTLALDGSGFVEASRVTLDGADVETTFIGASQLQAAIPDGLLASARIARVAVVNPPPAGGASGEQTFTINNPVPALSSLTPDQATVGDPAFTLTLDGAGFIDRSRATSGSATLATTFVSRSRLTASVPATATAVAASIEIGVVNPQPGGGASETRTLTINNPVPVLSSLSPDKAIAGGPGITLTLIGSGFVNTSQVTLGSATLAATLDSDTRLTASVLASALAAGGILEVRVVNASPGGGRTAPLSFRVESPLPVLATISPTSATAGDPDFTLTATGSGFVTTSRVSFAGTQVATTFLTPTQLTALIPAGAIGAAGPYDVTVVNAAPGGGISGVRQFTVNNPVPVLQSIAPSSVFAEGSAFTVTLTGSAFVATSQVTFAAGAVTSLFDSPTRLTATIPASAISVAGVFDIAVVSPSPGGGTSASQSFTVNNPAPTVSLLSPDRAVAGDPNFTLTVNGSAFVTTSGVDFGGTRMPTVRVSPAQVTAAIPASALAQGGSVPVQVVNPPPGGGTSAPMTFTVDNPVPVLSSISPERATAGAPGFTLTVDGSGFVTGSEVAFGGSRIPTTRVSPGRLTAAVPASSIAATGTVEVRVVNSAPGGGTSGPKSFAVLDPGIVTLASGQGGPAGVAVDATHLYWTNFDGGSVMKIPLSGGSPATVTAAEAAPHDIAVDGVNLYWVNYVSTVGTVVKMPISGGVPTVLATGQAKPLAVAVDATHVYWTNWDGNSVMRVPIAGVSPTLIAAGQGIAADIAIDGTSVYWTNFGDGRVVKAPLAGGSAFVLAQTQQNPYAIAVDATHVYWSNWTSGEIQKVPLAGGAATLLASGQVNPLRLSVDATNVYWTNHLDHKVMKVPLAGGTPTVLASGQNKAHSLTVDGTHVYWTTYQGGTVMKAPLAGLPPPATLAAGLTRPSQFGLDSTHLYWNNHDVGPNGSVMKLPLAGGSRVTLATGQNWNYGLVVRPTDVYWVNVAWGAPTSGAVMKVDLAGGTPTPIASGLDSPLDLAVDNANVYWLSYWGAAVMKVPLSGGTPTSMASGFSRPPRIAIDGTSVYWTNWNAGGAGAGTVLKAPLAGGPVVTLASNLHAPTTITVDASDVYWTNFASDVNSVITIGAGSIMKVPIGGGTPTVLAAGQNGPWGIAVDGTHVYWTASGRGITATGTVMKVPLAGGSPVYLAVGQDNPTDLTVDATRVYWGNWSNEAAATGAVMAAPK